jgi:hypothetical protein
MTTSAQVNELAAEQSPLGAAHVCDFRVKWLRSGRSAALRGEDVSRAARHTRPRDLADEVRQPPAFAAV